MSLSPRHIALVAIFALNGCVFAQNNSDAGATDVEPTPDVTSTNCDNLIDSYVTLENTRPSPFPEGTLFVTPNILTEEDPTSFIGLEYRGQGERQMFDRRSETFENFNAHLFDARFGTNKIVEIQVNPEFTRDEAEAEARQYANAMGRVPAFYFRQLQSVWIHRGDELAGGGNNNFLIHTGFGEDYIRDGIIEELFLHEGAHTSLDGEHANAPAWLAAQRADGAFLSDYARDNELREDLAETIGLWLALRFYRERISDELAAQIEETVPNRIKYLDCSDLTPDVLR